MGFWSTKKTGFDNDMFKPYFNENSHSIMSIRQGLGYNVSVTTDYSKTTIKSYKGSNFERVTIINYLFANGHQECYVEFIGYDAKAIEQYVSSRCVKKHNAFYIDQDLNRLFFESSQSPKDFQGIIIDCQKFPNPRIIYSGKKCRIINGVEIEVWD